jgi:molybdopterin-guanine dinucleotide biosynthesis protein A
MTSDPASFVNGVLLAGGQSRRMGGGDKSLRDLAGKPMLTHVIERLAPQVGALALNANGDPARFSSFGLPVISDTVEGFAGPLAGILSGMRWSMSVAPGVPWILTTSTDVPFLPLDLVHRLLEAATAGTSDAIAIATSGGREHPVIGLWPVALVDDVQRQLDGGVRKVMEWIGRHPSTLVEFPPLRFHGRMIDPFFNVNTPEDLEEARELIESRGQS